MFSKSDAALDVHDGKAALRRRFVLSAAASLVCAPAIVRAASLMPVRALILPVVRQWAGFVERILFASLAAGLEAGRVTTTLNGSVVSEAEARRIVAYARTNGFLSPSRSDA
jgi:hypothetical protein